MKLVTFMYSNGNLVETIDDISILDETGQLFTDSIAKKLECPRCSRVQTEEGHDACLGKLSGVKNACCGHGLKNEAYVMYDDGTTKRFKTTEDMLKFLGL